MRSSYEPLGAFIQQVNVRNTGLRVTNLRGVNITKKFMPSVANVHGTDLSKYKVVSKSQFAYNPMHVGRDEVLPISMSELERRIIVSPAYVVFEVTDTDRLLPEYLMMWCRRGEFDRYAWFTTDSSVRGGFSWYDFCNMELPIPSIDKQWEIVREYQTIIERLKLNESLIKSLEDTAQTIYKRWFEDFEFPISAEYAASIGMSGLEGQPYQSSGGEMVFSDHLGREIPLGWFKCNVGEIVNIKHGFAFKGQHITNENNGKVLLSPGNIKIGGGFKFEGVRFCKGELKDEYVFDVGDLMVTMTDLSKKTDTLGYPALIPALEGHKLLHNQRLGRAEYLTGFSYSDFLFQLMCSNRYRNEIVGGATGTTVKHTSPTKIMQVSFARSGDDLVYSEFKRLVQPIHSQIENRMIENVHLAKLSNLLHSKMTVA